MGASGAGTWESHHAITTLLFRYAELMDAADYDGLRELFADATLTNEGFPGEVVGGDAIVRLYERTNRVHADGTLRTRHLTTNVIVDVDEVAGSASARSAFVVFQATTPSRMASVSECLLSARKYFCSSLPVLT